MNLKPSPSDSCRYKGCTLTGALSATTHVRDAVTIIHGPKGCTHHNFSLLHATAAENERLFLPDLISTNLSESDIVFGGEKALFEAISSASQRNINAVYVLSTCVIETIGDDVSGVCGNSYGIPVVHIPTAGFLGGTFQEGLNNALCAIAHQAKPCKKSVSVNIIGEKNLEYEVEENYREVLRILALLGIPVNIRYIRSSSTSSLQKLGAATLNILRDPELQKTGEYLRQRFGTPFVSSFPVGFEGTIRFMETVGTRFGIDTRDAVAEEREWQAATLSDFCDLTGESVVFTPGSSQEPVTAVVGELAVRLGLHVGNEGVEIPVPFDPPIGSAGIRRLLHRWRCVIHA